MAIGTGVSTAMQRIFSIREPTEQSFQAFDVHGFGEHVFHHFADQRMIRNVTLTLNVFKACGCIRKNRC